MNRYRKSTLRGFFLVHMPSQNLIRKYWLIAFGGIITSFAFGFFTSQRLYLPIISDAPAIREGQEKYQYINPLLACKESDFAEYQELKPLKEELRGMVAKAKSEGKIYSASIYFRDPIRGKWLGVNEEEIYSPASLLKVPVMMAYFKQAETNPAILEQDFFYTRNPKNTNILIPDPLLSSGRNYRTGELIRGMIIDSDNDAKDLLTSAIDKKDLQATYADLGINSAYPASGDSYRISARTYALFFRVLYNATFLNREFSEKALQLLSEARFHKGLRAGIPSEIRIAHKYGVRVDANAPDAAVELSDCGIIYKNPDPYILCVMTKGKDVEMLASFIADIGNKVHATVRSSR